MVSQAVEDDILSFKICVGFELPHGTSECSWSEFAIVSESSSPNKRCLSIRWKVLCNIC